MKSRPSQIRVASQKPKSISELLSGSGHSVKALKTRLSERSRVLEAVCAALPADLAETVISAGIDKGLLTVGVNGAVWASRLRYFADVLKKSVDSAGDNRILSVKIRVVPPRGA